MSKKVLALFLLFHISVFLSCSKKEPEPESIDYSDTQKSDFLGTWLSLGTPRSKLVISDNGNFYYFKCQIEVNKKWDSHPNFPNQDLTAFTTHENSQLIDGNPFFYVMVQSGETRTLTRLTYVKKNTTPYLLLATIPYYKE